MKIFSRSGTGTLITLVWIGLMMAAPARADIEKIKKSGVLRVAVYDNFAPFSNRSSGIDIDLADALSKKIGLKMTLLPFPAGENLGDDLRNMVWKGHYLGYGPADLMMHVPVDRLLMNENPQVTIFAPYHTETVRLVRNIASVPQYSGLPSMAGNQDRAASHQGFSRGIAR